MTERPRAILFDFDGTLADTFPRVSLLMPRLARELRFRDPGPNGLEELRGLSVRQILSSLRIAWWKVPLVLWRARVLLRAEGGDIALFPGMAELLRELDGSGLEWGILSTNGLDVVRDTLRRAGAPEPGWLEAGLGLSGKTARLRRMARRLGVSRRRLLLVSDEVRDFEASRRAGVPMVAVAWGYSLPSALEQAGANVVRDVGQLRELLLGIADPAKAAGEG